ncbi:hypothetical protein BKA70DRAFT_1440735 [Coprinopsis sp. MPI-PUGE-AT-0042]|nr:hypothetical protein BKA70DRAFT_1440735 [Coprinopsis sp. MPI-PUGE-AT-0042]
MLTLFKPWQTGLELKQDNQLWDEAFRTSPFDCYTCKLIDNINLRYECMDAKDNLKSQHKKKYRAALGLSPEDDDFDDIDDFDDGLDAAINANGSLDDDGLLGKNRLSRLNQMRQAQNIMTVPPDITNAGGAAGVQAHPVVDSIVDDITLASPHVIWKNIVKSKRAEVLDKKNKHAPPAKKKFKKGALLPLNEGPILTLLDESYLGHDFKAEEKGKYGNN